MMTFEQFQATGTDCADLGVALDDDTLTNSSGRLYLGRLYIERWEDDRFGVAPPNGEPTWLLTLYNEQFQGDLQDMERRLFDFAVDEEWIEPKWRTEFPDYPVEAMPDIPAGFEDRSWHNEPMPSFIHEASGVVLWVDYPDASQREFSDSARFSAVRCTTRHPEAGWQFDRAMVDLFETDDWPTVARSLPNFTQGEG